MVSVETKSLEFLDGTVRAPGCLAEGWAVCGSRGFDGYASHYTVADSLAELDLHQALMSTRELHDAFDGLALLPLQFQGVASSGQAAMPSGGSVHGQLVRAQTYVLVHLAIED